MIFIGIGIVNFGLLLFSSLYGLLIVDLAIIITLLILLLEGQNGIIRKLNRRKDSQELQALLRQKEEAEQEIDKNDLPSEKDIKDLSSEKD